MRRKAGRRNSMEWNKGCSPEDMAAIEHFAPEQNGCEKIEKEQAEKAAAASDSHAEEKPAKAQITIDDFDKVELKVAEVVACEKLEKSKKLLKLTVKLGNEQRQVVSGIAKAYTPEELVGKKIVMVTNLKPAKLCGELSEGMILCAEGSDGTLSVLTPARNVEDGSGIS